ncbi:SBBP repeat-containing protein [Leptolyngbya sp. 7M]|uniref:SBBP repeat-containing protein n=1 Tax=Leptolyngbya sp. 7M TaxID=2812896 RepID=UPI001B8BBAA3|nr:SBBP repeat-containing protein [Leptolyngbya sp. 7M]QYO67502.1 SBBP repeat-containing protein [Leptolyngbya sp. 7M]
MNSTAHELRAEFRLECTAQLGTPQDDEAYAIVTDSSGTLYVSGQTQGTFPTSGSQNQGNYDVWLAKYS